jgi:hypothetical protein
MSGNLRENLTIVATAAAVIAFTAVASCAPLHSPPTKVEETRPTVSYKYSTDEELIQARPQAATFCSQYQATPRAARITTDADGAKVVVFECVTSLPLPPPNPPNLNQHLTYTYQTDAELMNAWQSAQDFCMKNGRQYVASNITQNVNGTKTVTFRCTPA